MSKTTLFGKKIRSKLWISMMLWGVIGEGHSRNRYGSKQFLTGTTLDTTVANARINNLARSP